MYTMEMQQAPGMYPMVYQPGHDPRVLRQREADEDENEERRILAEAFWCYYCFCCGCGLEHCTSPLAHDNGAACCIRWGWHTTVPCSKTDGCIGKTNKCCCLVEMCEFPTSQTPGVGCCNTMCCLRNLEEPSGVAPEEDDEEEQRRLMHDTFWCYYCYCWGCGCGHLSDPCVKQYGKCFCFQSDFETMGCCEHGIYDSTLKYFCCVNHCRLPPGDFSPGCGCCGVLKCGNVKDDGAAD